MRLQANVGASPAPARVLSQAAGSSMSSTAAEPFHGYGSSLDGDMMVSAVQRSTPQHRDAHSGARACCRGTMLIGHAGKMHACTLAC